LEEGIDGFNNKLIEYLIWYNTKRPHYALNYQTPIEFMLKYLQTNHQKINYCYTFEECKMWVTYTKNCKNKKVWYNIFSSI
ncbi:MAG: integrase core domain-containing protein, partial [Candidatus Pacearchaeota archaeon]